MVDLPAPEGPIRPMISPDCNSFDDQKIFLNLVNVAMFSYASSLVSVYSLLITNDIIVSKHSLVKDILNFFKIKTLDDSIQCL